MYDSSIQRIPHHSLNQIKGQSTVRSYSSCKKKWTHGPSARMDSFQLPCPVILRRKIKANKSTLRVTVTFLRDTVTFLRDAVTFLRDSVTFLRVTVTFLRDKGSV